MASFKRFSLVLMSSTALLALSGCDGADGVASPGAGTVVINPPAPAPSPSPSPTPTPSPITAAQFAAVTAVNGISVTADEQLAIVNAGANNNVNGTNATLNGVFPAGAASLATAVDPSTINSFFTSTNYVGALNGATDTAFQGWTCNSTTAQFGGSGTSCTSVPRSAAAGRPRLARRARSTTDWCRRSAPAASRRSFPARSACPRSPVYSTGSAARRRWAPMSARPAPIRAQC